MSRLKISTPDRAQLTVERLYKDLERHIVASPPGLCPVDLQLSFLKLCHAQTCGKCVPCRVGLLQLQNLLEQVLDGTATIDTLALIEETANNITDSADCAIGFEAAHMVLAGLQAAEMIMFTILSMENALIPSHSRCPAWRSARPVWTYRDILPWWEKKDMRMRFPSSVRTILSLRHAPDL